MTDRDSSVDGDISPERFNRLVTQAKALGYEGESIEKYIEKAIDRDLRTRERLEKISQGKERLALEAAEKEKDRAEKEKDRLARIESEEKERDMREKERMDRLRVDEAQAEKDRLARIESEEKERDMREKERMDRLRVDEAQAEKDRLARIESEEKERDLKGRELQLKHELELEKIRVQEKSSQSQADLQREFVTSTGTFPGMENRGRGYQNMPKLPLFREDKDDIDAFIYRFEAHAQLCKWDRAAWPIHFASCLQGVPLSFYHSLCVMGSLTYDDMKTHFLKKFLCTEEGFRERFRAAKPETAESFPAFMLRLSHYFDRWIELAKVSKTFEALRDLMLKEHILQSVAKDLSVFLKERIFGSLTELAESAERFREAHPGKTMSRGRENPLAVSSVAQETPQQATVQPPRGGRGNSRFQSYGGRGAGQSLCRTENVQGSRDTVVYRGGVDKRWQRGARSGRGRRGPQASDVCRKCGGVGHWSHQCPTAQGQGNVALACKVLCSADIEGLGGALQLHTGFVADQEVSVLRDTGCTTAGVRKSLVDRNQYTGEAQRCVTFGGQIEEFPLATVSVRTGFFSGKLLCCVIESPVADLILGNLPGISDTPQGAVGPRVALVTTRLQKQREKESSVPLCTAVPPELQVDRATLGRLQKGDKSLHEWFVKAESGVTTESVSFQVKDGVLYRSFNNKGEVIKQIVVPQSLREAVLTTAHDGITAGHCGVRRTVQRVMLRFFWPQVRQEVRKYCQTCDVCQKAVAKGRVQPVPLEKMPVVDVPYKRIAVDLIGPFTPTSRNGFRYILTVMDVATRFPEAVPLRNIDTITVAEALMSIFSRVGYPEEILSDCGTQFVSGLMIEIYRLLSIKSVHTSPYHPQANGLVERFNGTLKTMLKKVVQAHPEQWDRYIPALLFAYRELPSESTSFSPYELLYGRRPRGPIDLLARMWTDDEKTDKQTEKPLYQYVMDLKTVLTDSMCIARDNVTKASDRYKHYFDKKAEARRFSVGDEVLVLLPSDSNKLLAEWKGPFSVLEVLGVDYKIQMGKVHKVFHINMLQQYHRRSHCQKTMTATMTSDKTDSVGTKLAQSKCVVCDTGLFPFTTLTDVGFTTRDVQTDIAAVSVIHSDDEDEVLIGTLPSIQGESIDQVNYDDRLSDAQKTDIAAVCAGFTQVFTDKPGVACAGIVHEINLTSDKPVRMRPYSLPFASRKIVEAEVKTMLDLGVIELSQSPYSSPIVLVKKKDGNTRFCIDFRALNKVTVFDAEPIPDVEELFCRLSGGRFFTKIDLAKGYWQIPVREADKPKTAFQTSEGLFQWTRMPFGLVTAPATFARMMRALKLDRFSALNFFDDVLISSEKWSQHLKHVRGVLKAISDFGLTVRPTKMFAGFRELEFLGHVISEGVLKPQDDKVKKILTWSRPRTRKQVRSLLGLTGYYRRFVPDFADLAKPLTDLTRETSAKQIVWTDDCETAFKKIRDVLTSAPVLKLPELSEQFVVRTDASGSGVGAVLLQACKGVLHPVMFVSRKLLDRETRYSTIERECLAIVWAINKLARYLWGQEFVLQTDHRPLTFLNSGRFKNNRLIRWALSLQEFRFVVEPVAGRDNVLADCLSRSECCQEIP